MPSECYDTVNKSHFSRCHMAPASIYEAPPAPSRSFPVYFPDGEIVYPEDAYPLRHDRWSSYHRRVSPWMGHPCGSHHWNRHGILSLPHGLRQRLGLPIQSHPIRPRNAVYVHPLSWTLRRIPQCHVDVTSWLGRGRERYGRLTRSDGKSGGRCIQAKKNSVGG